MPACPSGRRWQRLADVSINSLSCACEPERRTAQPSCSARMRRGGLRRTSPSRRSWCAETKFRLGPLPSLRCLVSERPNKRGAQHTGRRGKVSRDYFLALSGSCLPYRSDRAIERMGGDLWGAALRLGYTHSPPAVPIPLHRAMRGPPPFLAIGRQRFSLGRKAEPYPEAFGCLLSEVQLEPRTR
jgi:hypothetical protein